MRDLKCLRCGAPMVFLMREKFQRGDMGMFVGDLNLSMHGGFEMEVYSCPKCGRLEFFLPGREEELTEPELSEEDLPPESDCGIVGVSLEGVPQVRCPACGVRHDFDYPQCPKCGYKPGK